jgi:hypothetical protein
MSILINNLKITDNGLNLNINVTTNIGHIISSIFFWKMNDFKKTEVAIDLSEYLEQSSNVEDLVITAESIGLEKFEDICFIEITSSFEDLDDCGNLLSPSIGITYDLSQYYGCLLASLLEIPLDCTSCNTDKINQKVITINMLIDTIVKSIDIAYYTEAISMVKKLKQLCGLNNCNTCKSIECISCNNFIQI